MLVCQREPQVAFGLERRVQYRAVVHRRHRVPVDKGLILAGLKLVEIGDAHQVTREELEAAIDPQTLCIVYVAGDDYGPVLPLNVVIDVARSRGVAVVVDAAAELPPRSNLWYFSRELGADLTIFSGGKDLGAPAGTGLIVGRPELVGACRKLDSPNGTLARPLKVGADGVLGMMAAVSEYMARDDSARWRQCEETIDRWQAMMLGVQGISSRRVSPCKGLPPLALAIAFDDQLGNKTAAQAKQFLWEGSPRVAVGQSGTDEIVLASYTLGPGDEDRVARRLLAFLGR
ncbi:MAG TPA: aminotransferase class V-fold PLP-dependent enzyme [Polyangiaceae bacterium]|nr:aminotransferase class V-fold PLP-dependent enzyme [Polyangiaceae bacterium]